VCEAADATDFIFVVVSEMIVMPFILAKLGAFFQLLLGTGLNLVYE
jgi:hypothetical protein